MKSIDRIRNIITDNDWFMTDSGRWFRNTYGVNDIVSVISFCGRSRNRECYNVCDGYVSHLYIDRNGDVMVQLVSEDTDDEMVPLIHPSGIPIENFSEDMISKWVDILTF